MPLKNLSIRRLAAPFWGKHGRVTAAFQQDRTGVWVCGWVGGWVYVCKCVQVCVCVFISHIINISLQPAQAKFGSSMQL